jgi:SAM-dependent methyltransferase
MPATERLQEERAFHDLQARDRAGWFADHPQQYRFDDDAYLDHETWVRPAFEQLGEVRGLPVLDFGCGHGMAAVVLARRGAHVTAFDLAGGYVDEARRRGVANGVEIDLVRADGQRLPFADGAFARIWGHAVLHHLDLRRAGPELRRVLQPGGRAVFCEPWGGNPLLNWARRRLAFSGKQHTPDEEPLHDKDLCLLGTLFQSVEVRGYQLLGMARRFLKSPWRRLDWCDEQLLHRVPALQRFCRYVVLTLGRAAPGSAIPS